MSKRGVGILMIVTAAVGLGALVQDYRFDGWIAAERAASAALSRDAATPSDTSNGIDTAGASPAAVAASDQRIAVLSQVRLAMNGVALVFVLGVAFYLGRVVTAMHGRGEPTTAQMFRNLPPPVKTSSTTQAAQASHAGHTGHAVLVGPAGSVGPAGPAGLVGAPAGTLTAAAELCVDLARVMDTADVTALLERTASVLGARGLVLWAADSDGARLRPALSHGYPEKVLAKLRPLQIDSDNVTALAFRTLQPQVLNGAAAGDPAAIAIPLLTASGCVGVMAAELRQNRPHVDLLPVARILGAQFSSLITPAEEPRRSAHA